MRADGRTVPDGETIQTDVCIIGAGPAGMILAQRLGRSGREVVLLEQGEAEGEGLLEPLRTTDSIGLEYDVDKHRGGGVGGSVHKWLVTTPLGDGFGRIPELGSDDFEVRRWIPESGWPFPKHVLQDYYRSARELFETDWPSSDPESDWEASLEQSRTIRSLDGVAPRVFPLANPAVFPGAVRRNLEQSNQVLLLTNASAIELEIGDEISEVKSVIVAQYTGKRFQIVASRFVLAAGGIENARVLLNSRNRWPHGVGNDTELVGRYFMEHPRFAAGIFVPRDSALFAAKRFHAVTLLDGIPTQTKYRLNPAAAECEEVANHIFFFRPARWTVAALAAMEGWYDPRPVQASRELVRSLQRRRLPKDGFRLSRHLARGIPHLWRISRAKRYLSTERKRVSDDVRKHPDFFKIEVMAEQVPNRESRIRILHDRDKFGANRAALDWRLTDADLTGFARAQEYFGTALETAGLGEAFTYLRPGVVPRGLYAASHHMGTTRMHRNPRQGVVDEHGRVHGIRNLYVAGSSVFPTGGSANPTLTVLALTLRLADELRSNG